MLLLGSNNRELVLSNFEPSTSFQVKDQGDKITLKSLALCPTSSGGYAQPSVVVAGMLKYSEDNLIVSKDDWGVSDIIDGTGISQLLLSVQQGNPIIPADTVTTQIIVMVAGSNKAFFPLLAFSVKHTDGIVGDDGLNWSKTFDIALPGCFKVVLKHKTVKGSAQIIWGLS